MVTGSRFGEKPQGGGPRGQAQLPGAAYCEPARSLFPFPKGVTVMAQGYKWSLLFDIKIMYDTVPNLFFMWESL